MKSRYEPAQCIFCDYFGRLSKEDFWPKWLRKHIEERSDRPGEMPLVTSHTRSFKIGGDFGETPIKIVGGPLSSKKPPHFGSLHVVCHACNNEWMSRITNDAKKPLLSLIKGDWKSLEREDLKKLSVWAVLFTMVVEFGGLPETVGTPRSERLEFREAKTPNSHWSVYLGNYRGRPGRGWYGCHWHRGGSIAFVPPELEASVRVSDKKTLNFLPFQATTFCIGEAVFHCFREYVPGAFIKDLIASHLGLSIIWPLPEMPLARSSIFLTDPDITQLIIKFWSGVSMPIEPEYIGVLQRIAAFHP